jgi:hypothetical protein
MSSDWPVCPVADVSAPRRMGAALTYARRYALFTLVGIAGEDDLDAPDLDGNRTDGRPAATGNGQGPPGANGHAAPAAPGIERAKRSAGVPTAPKPLLGLEASAGCRDRLLEDMTSIGTADELAVWAQRVLPTKNTMRTEDAAIVERAFAARLDQVFGPPGSEDSQVTDSEDNAPAVQPEPRAPGGAAVSAPPASDDSAVGLVPPSSEMPVPDAACAELAFGKTRRKRDKDHRAFVASKPCLVCGRCPADAHHLRFAQPRALGAKVSDEFTVPLCRIHHRELHLRVDEPAWWDEHKIDALAAAQLLWAQTRNPHGEGAKNPVGVLAAPGDAR